MKIKGISIFEQHVEKFVLLLAVVALLAVAAMQFVLRPNRVMVDGRDVDPGQVDVILKERADALAQKIRDDSKLEQEVFSQPAPRIASEFEKKLAAGVTSGQPLPAIAAAIAGPLTPVDLGADTWYYQPRVPAATILAEVSQTADALADNVVAQHPELAARFPNAAAPKDIVWTTPAAIIDPKAIRDELRRTNAGATPPQAQVPTPWYNDSLYVVDVRFEREERLAGGGWGSPVVVDVIPGQTTFRPRLSGTADAGVRNDLFTRLGDRVVQRQVLQPDFLPTRNGAFVPPTMPGAEAAKGGNEEADQLAGVIARLKGDRARQNDQLKEIGGPLEDTPKDSDKGKDDSKDKGRGDKGDDKGKGAAPPGGGGGLSGGFAGNKGDKGAEGKDSEKSKARRIALTKKLKELDAKIARFESELKALAPDMKVEGAAGGGIDLAGDQPVLVWAHDIGVQPGTTYRYRAIVDVYNPFFARGRQLVKAQAGLSDKIAMESLRSEWSKPVDVTPPVAFFVTRAIPGEGPLGLGSARVEVYRLHDGKWRREEFSVSPGDRIGRASDSARVAASKEVVAGEAKGGGKDDKDAATAASGPIDFSTDWYIVDVVEDNTAERRPSSDQRTALVVIQKLDGQGRVEIRDPAREMGSDYRKRLERDWKVGSFS